MNALKTLHSEIMTRVCKRLADIYHVSKVVYEVGEANAKFKEQRGEGWLEMTIYNYGNRGNLKCYLSRYGNRRGGDYKSLLSGGTTEHLYAAINKLIAEREQP